MSAWMPALCGLLIGAVAGFAVRRARLCTFGAIEDALMGGDGRRMKIFGLALGIAILGTQGLVLGGILRPEDTTFAPPALSLISIMVVLVLGACAYAGLRGIFGDFRIIFLEKPALPMPGDLPADIASLSSLAAGIDLRALIAVLAGVSLCWLALADTRLWRARRLLTAGVLLGFAVIAGWLATSLLGDDFSAPARPQSLTFVSTIGKAFYAGLLNVGGFNDFGVGSVFGVIIGSCLAAWYADELQWEAFDDDREMRRHLAGGALMGVGGILAGGCTIGQGISAGSMLALSWPFAVGGMVLGARLGITMLVDGSPRDMMQRGWSHLTSRIWISK